MSIRSYIARENPDGTLTGIYCHSDGYPERVGQDLLEHYADPARVDALLALGNLSALGPEIGRKTSFAEYYEKRLYTQCLAYHRDRDDPFERWYHFPDRVAATKGEWGRGGLKPEWGYLYQDGKWLVCGLMIPEEEREWRPVQTVLDERAGPRSPTEKA